MYKQFAINKQKTLTTLHCHTTLIAHAATLYQSFPLFLNNTYIITGHTPTTLIREDGEQLVYEENGHIAIDCGCVFGGKLAAYCLDTGEVYYVEGNK